LFDDFDCQEHYFGVPEPGKLYGKINWRIAKPNDDFIERSTVQTFKQVAPLSSLLLLSSQSQRPQKDSARTAAVLKTPSLYCRLVYRVHRL